MFEGSHMKAVRGQQAM